MHAGPVSAVVYIYHRFFSLFTRLFSPESRLHCLIVRPTPIGRNLIWQEFNGFKMNARLPEFPAGYGHGEILNCTLRAMMYWCVDCGLWFASRNLWNCLLYFITWYLNIYYLHRNFSFTFTRLFITAVYYIITYSYFLNILN